MLGFEFAWYLAKLICASQHTQGLAAKKITSEKEGKGPDYGTPTTRHMPAHTAKCACAHTLLRVQMHMEDTHTPPRQCTKRSTGPPAVHGSCCHSAHRLKVTGAQQTSGTRSDHLHEPEPAQTMAQVMVGMRSNGVRKGSDSLVVQAY
eukprot:1136740-Pelagomonas_calceolata.AAC.3